MVCCTSILVRPLARALDAPMQLPVAFPHGSGKLGFCLGNTVPQASVSKRHRRALMRGGAAQLGSWRSRESKRHSSRQALSPHVSVSLFPYVLN